MEWEVTMRTIKVGILGTGFSASSHIEALRRIPNIEIVGVSSRELKKAEQFAAHHHIPKAYADATELINDPDIEVIHNCTTNHLHFQFNKEILLAGKHLMTEKPLAINSEQSEELVELAKKSNVISGICFNYRFYPLVAQMREDIRTKKHGKANLVYGGYVQDWCSNVTDYSWRMDKELNGESRAIADIGSHWCDTVEHILGKRIVSVCADLGTVHKVRYKSKDGNTTFSQAKEDTEMVEVPIDTEDYGSVLVRFEDNIQGVFTVSQVSVGRKNNFHFDLVTDQATLAWDQEKPNELWIGRRDKANEVLVKDPSLLSENASKMAHFPGGHQEGWPDGLKNLFLNFYEAVSKNDTQAGDFATIADGHHIMQIIEAILESNRTRSWVDIKEEGLR